MKICCPVCGSDLIHEIIDDGIRQYKIKDNELIEIYNRSNGEGSVFCENDKTHDIPMNISEELIDFTYKNI